MPSCTARPEPVEGRAARSRSWFDKLTTSGMGVVLLSASLAGQSRTVAGSGQLRVGLPPAEVSARPAYVEVSGLGAEELAAARTRAADDAAMASLLRVTVADQADANLPAIAGRYAISDRAITFTPRFQFDLGREY